MRLIPSALVVLALLPASAAAASSQVMTSVTTYRVSDDIRINAPPTYVWEKGDEPSDETVFSLAKSVGAVVIAVWAGPGLLPAYAVAAGVLGAFKPLAETVKEGLSLEDYAAVTPGSAAYVRLAERGQARIGADGKVIFEAYRSMASDRWRLGDLVHYTYRGLYSRTGKANFRAYIGGEIFSFVAGKAAGLFGIHPGAEELVGALVGSAAENDLRARLSSNGGSRGPLVMTMPSGTGGRSVPLPYADLTPSLPASTQAPPSALLIAPADVPPFAVAEAVTTFRTAGAAAVAVVQPAPSVLVVMPQLSSATAGDTTPITDDPEPPPDNSGDRSIDLPSSVEIHGFGSFSIHH